MLQWTTMNTFEINEKPSPQNTKYQQIEDMKKNQIEILELNVLKVK